LAEFGRLILLASALNGIAEPGRNGMKGKPGVGFPVVDCVV